MQWIGSQKFHVLGNQRYAIVYKDISLTKYKAVYFHGLESDYSIWCGDRHVK